MSLERKEFCASIQGDIERLMLDARSADELSFLFAVLGINSGAEDAGWQPIAETQALFYDLVGLLNAPLHDEARARIGLLLYCHITEASYIYHVIYNLLLTVEKQPPKLFSFLDKYRGSVPPSATTKVNEIREKCVANGYVELDAVLDDLIRPDIRNAFYHSDYILFDGKMRLKHKGSEIKQIPLEEVFRLIEKTTDFFNLMTKAISDGRRVFPEGYKIEGRKNAAGQPLSSIDVIVSDGMATGFGSSDPLPLW